jgi:hypothetical protein
MRAARIDLGEVVDLREEAGRIVIQPVRQKNVRPGQASEWDHFQ